MKKGFVIIPILIAFSLALIVGFGYTIYKKSHFNPNQYEWAGVSITPSITPESVSNSPTLTTVPTITPTKKPIPTKKPNTPTPKPTTAQTSCSQFKPADGLATITITLKEKSGQSLAGDWTVKIKPTGACPGMLSPGWNGELTEIVRQPTYTYKSPGFSPGQFRVDVNYHTSGSGFDVDATSGDHSNEVGVSN